MMTMMMNRNVTFKLAVFTFTLYFKKCIRCISQVFILGSQCGGQIFGLYTNKYSTFKILKRFFNTRIITAVI